MMYDCVQLLSPHQDWYQNLHVCQSLLKNGLTPLLFQQSCEKITEVFCWFYTYVTIMALISSLTPEHIFYHFLFETFLKFPCFFSSVFPLFYYSLKLFKIIRLCVYLRLLYWNFTQLPYTRSRWLMIIANKYHNLFQQLSLSNNDLNAINSFSLINCQPTIGSWG